MPSFRLCVVFLSILILAVSIFYRVKSFPGEEDAELASVTYDFIIVGGGTAGCVLANRLSANGQYTVLVVEAGGIPPDSMNIPGLAQVNQENSDMTFQYQSVSQKHVGGSVVKIPLGRVLGGTSQINYMMVNRGSPHDYDNWANVTGDPSWRYENMLQYFKRSEQYLGQFPNQGQHGSDGPIPVNFQEYAPGRNEWLRAGMELGFQVRDANGPQQISFTPAEFNRRFGRRVSSYSGYLKPIMASRSKLTVLTNSYVTRVEFVGTTAVGVRYNADGSVSSTSPKLAYAKREIILSAGTYGSAALLMRSGVGPRNVLDHAGVRLIKEFPVGENFQEHPAIPIHIILNNKSLSVDPTRDYSPESFALFQQSGVGPYTSVNGYGDGGQAFLSSSVARREGHPDWPDVQLCLYSTTAIMAGYRNFSLEPEETSIVVVLYLGREKSRGSVRLDPENVDGMPLIDFNYLAEEMDEDVLLEGCSHLPFRTREYWKCFMRETLIPGNHPVGTCSMNSVVDSSLNVIGISKLRVVDASVMPFITNTNLQAAIYAIAEKTADTIVAAALAA